MNANDGETLSLVALYQAKLGYKTKGLENIQRARRLAPGSRKVQWEAALICELAEVRGEPRYQQMVASK